MKRMRHIITCLTLGCVVAALSLLCWFAPKDTFSESERRPLGSFPALNASSISSGRFMDQFETYAQDAFPFRDAFRSVKALASKNVFLKLDNNGLYTASIELEKADGDTYKATSIVSMEYPLDESSVERAAERFSAVYERYLQGTDIRVFLSIIPDKNYFFGEPSGHLAMDYPRLFELMQAGMPYAEYIDITETLDAGSYYLTDPHWAQENLTGTASALLAGMGAAEADLGNAYFVEVASDTFYGSYYGQAALPVQPDTLAFLTNDVIDSATAYDHQNDRAIPLYDLSKTPQTIDEALVESPSNTPSKVDPYDLFLGGPLSLVTVESPMAKTDRELIVFRDSFGSSIAPLLLSEYAKITLVDIRYMQPAVLGEFIEFDSQDVLFLYSTSVLNNSETIR